MRHKGQCRTEGRRQKAEGRRRKAEGRRQKAEGRRQKAEGRRRKAEGGGQKAEGARQKAEGRRQKAEGRRQKAEGRFPPLQVFRLRVRISDFRRGSSNLGEVGPGLFYLLAGAAVLLLHSQVPWPPLERLP